MKDPSCACCGDSYSSYRLCTTCAADPANADWREANWRERGSNTDDEPAPNRDPISRALKSPGRPRGTPRSNEARALLAERPRQSVPDIARSVGLSERRTYEILREMCTV